ncbi:hypothetical protein MPLDJ20_80061 [Mesorhizobium plurifarium]|uniref:Uncharacterized protein n=1 Tax=Mesorhizobium plurifarium TaxID=69974 RepID=A0A090GRF0_MESPL|nr:hypothetical protein MPLDJ20_80061 [Mesorhizobium plurifarium]
MSISNRRYRQRTGATTILTRIVTCGATHRWQAGNQSLLDVLSKPGGNHDHCGNCQGFHRTP